jgi:methionyl-tRNA formyltransferase
MRILYLGNNWVGWKVVAWLRQQGENVVGLVVHPPENRTFGDEILATAGVEPSCAFEASRLADPPTIEAIKALRPDIGVSVSFGYILRREVLELFPAGCVNLHPALLPWNRGAHPNVWSIIEGTPAGVTLHYVDEGVDTGDIIDQREVRVAAEDTGETLYRRLENASVQLFQDCWGQIRSGKAPRRPQPEHGGSVHRVKDLERIGEIELDRQYTARYLINLLRARTFPPFGGAYFRDGDRRLHLRLALIDEKDIRAERRPHVRVD